MHIHGCGVAGTPRWSMFIASGVSIIPLLFCVFMDPIIIEYVLVLPLTDRSIVSESHLGPRRWID
jgi:hypothetical protein